MIDRPGVNTGPVRSASSGTTAASGESATNGATSSAISPRDVAIRSATDSHDGCSPSYRRGVWTTSLTASTVSRSWLWWMAKRTTRLPNWSIVSPSSSGSGSMSSSAWTSCCDDVGRGSRWAIVKPSITGAPYSYSVLWETRKREVIVRSSSSG